MTEFIPAIIPKNFRDLEEKLSFLKGVSKVVQIDIVDGKFAGDTPSWPLFKTDENFLQIINEEKGMPFWEDYEFEIDLMVSDPLSFYDSWVRAGATSLVFHIETLNFDEDRLILDQIKSSDIIKIGFAISIDTPNEEIEKYVSYADFVQVMGINPIGFQHIDFDERCIEKILWIKSNFPDIEIAVDGGMNPKSIPLVCGAGATKIIVGSFFLESTNPIDAKRNLKALV